MKQALRHLPGIFLASFLMFLLVNILAYIYLDHFPLYDEEEGLFITRFSEEGLALRKQAFDSDDRVVLDQYADPPGLMPHTVLHFTEGNSKPFYTVGLEGLRYLPGWTDEFVKQKLQTGRGSVFVFGGSTTFGDGVPDGETVTAYLAETDSGLNFFNFAAQSYDSMREVDKLLHLLRKGYRAESVIFIDGLNDVTTFASSPYDIYDSPRTLGLVLDRGEIPAIFGMPVDDNMLLSFAYSFPITHLYYKFTGDEFGRGPFSRRSGSDPGSRKWQELMYMHFNWAGVQAERADALAEEVASYYRENIRFVQLLGDSFGFEPMFVYQPIALLDPDNPFLTKKFSTSNYLAIYQEVDERIRKDIASGALDMIDCSAAIVASNIGYPYVDATHFSPRGNEALARCVYENFLLLSEQGSETGD